MTSPRAPRTTSTTIARALGVVGAAALLAGFGLAPTSAGAKVASKVTICHATDSTSNPYIKVKVPASSVDGKGANDHTNHGGGLFDFSAPDSNSAWGDIIPDAPGVAFSMNATESGLGIFANGCNGPDQGSCPDGSDPVGGECPTEETCPDGLPAVGGECGDDEIIEVSDGGTTDGGTTDGGTTDGGSTDGSDGSVVTDDGGSTDGGSTGGSTDGGSTDGSDGSVVTDDGGTTDGGSTDGGSTDGSDGSVVTDDGGSTDGGSTGGSTDGGSTDGGSTGGTDKLASLDDGGSTDGGSTDGGSTDGTDQVVSTDDGGSTDGGSTDGGSTDGVTTEDELTTTGGAIPTADPDADSGTGVEVEGLVIHGSTAQNTARSLPVTGVDSLPLTAAGVTLVGLGVALAVWARQSRA